MAKFYRPLDVASDEFRLLKICPGLSGSPIVCKLDTVPLGNYSRHPEGVYRWSDGKIYGADWQSPASEAANVQWVPDYEALSYTWGDATIKRTIEVNSEPMQVTRNLYEALEALRQPDEERSLWCDAICINQADLSERSAQVKRMRSIYQRAKQTIMWLGDLDEVTEHAINILERLGCTQQQMDGFQWPVPLLGWQGPCFDPSYDIADAEQALFNEYGEYIQSVTKVRFADLEDDDWAAMESFFGKPYWNRIWVIQEIANSQDIEVRCGSKSVAFGTLKNLQFVMAGKQLAAYSSRDALCHERMRALILEPFQIIQQRALTRHPMRTFGMEYLNTSFLSSIEKFRSFQCTDPRDKVYALLGLVSIDRNMPLPEPDYSKSVFEVYSETVRAIVSHTADLSVLCLSKSFGGMVEHQMSSWVPDWTVKPLSKALTHESYQATGESLPRGPAFNPQTSSKEKLRRMIDNTRTMQIVEGSDSLPANGQIHRPIYQVSTLPDPKVLRLDGFKIDDIMLSSKGIPDPKFEKESGGWKQSIIDWERLLRAFRVYRRLGDQVQEVDPGFRHPKMAEFVLTLFRGLLFAHDTLPQLAESDDLEDVYLEHYLVWTGRISALDARAPISEAVLGAIFDHVLKDNLRGWKFATTKQGRLAMIPSHAEKQDVVVMLFGADVPVLLRPVCQLKKDDGSLETRWVQMGTAYVHGLMTGEALDMLERKKLKVETFSLM